MNVVESWLLSISPQLVWAPITPGIGLIYLISFTSIVAQVVPAAAEVRRCFAW